MVPYKSYDIWSSSLKNQKHWNKEQTVSNQRAGVRGIMGKIPLRLAVCPSAATPTDFYCQRFWACISPRWNPALCGLSHSPGALLGLSTCECGTAQTTSCPLTLVFCQPLPCRRSSLPQLPISMCPTSLDECFLFNSLVIWPHIVWYSGSSGCFWF